MAKKKAAAPAQGADFPEGLVQTIPIGRLVESPFNPRKTFAEDRLTELAASIRMKGLIQPIVVRPRKGVEHQWAIAPINDAAKLYDVFAPSDPSLPQRHIVGKEAAQALASLLGEDCFEVIAGARRLRACKLAGLRVVACIVKDVDDKTAREIQIVENDQREDLDPIERAEGYRDMIATLGYSAESLAAKLHKSLGYVYGFLKLADLPERARKAVSDGTLPAATAQLVARIPNATLRDKCAQEVLRGRDHYGSDKGMPLSYRATKDLIERQYVKELKGSPFDQADAALSPDAGSCAKCPKRTGNNRAEFPDGRADLCTDPGCYDRKLQLHVVRVGEKAAKRGTKVLPEAQTAKLFTVRHAYEGSRPKATVELAYHVPYVDLDSPCYDGQGGGKTYRKLIGKAVQEHVVGAVAPNGQLHYLVPTNISNQALRGSGVLSKEQAERKASSYDRDHKRRELRAKIEKEVVRRAVIQAAITARAVATGCVGWTPALVQTLKTSLVSIIDGGSADVCRYVIQAHKLHKDAGQGQPRTVGGIRVMDNPLIDYIRKETAAPALVAVLAELAVGKELLHYTFTYAGDLNRESAQTQALCKTFGIDRAKLRREVTAEARAKGKKAREKRAAAGNGTPQAPAKKKKEGKG